MATISKLVVSLSANSAKLVTELGKTRKKTAAFVKHVRKQFNTMAKAIAASMAAAVAAIGAIVDGRAEEIDRLAKTASKLGIDTSALQKLRYQAELSGVSVGTLDMAMQRMVRRVSEAAAGTGEAKDAIKELGLHAGALAKLSPEQQFYALSDAMQNIAGQGDKVRLAMKLFDSEGVSLVNAMNGSLSDTGDEFDKLGISITRQQAAMVESYNDSKAKLSAIWGGFVDQVTVQVAPAFQLLIDYISSTVVEFGGMGQVATKVVNGIATAAGFVADVFYGWQLIIKGVQVAFGRLSQAALNALGWVYDKYADLRELMDDGFQRSDFFDGMADAFKFQSDKVQTELNDLLTKGRPSLEIDAKIAKIQADVAKAGEKATVSNTDASKQNTVATNALTDAVKKSDKAGGPAWEKIFGKEKDDKKELKISTQFADYAKALKASINRGDTNSMAYFVKEAQRTLDAVAGRGPNGLSFGNDRDHDIDGMQSVLDKLVSQMNEKPESVGSIDINVMADGKAVGGKLMGDPAFLKQLKSFVDKSTNQTARAVAR